VNIDFRWDGPNSWIRIADDGTGMSGTTITEAMRFGSDRDYGLDDLGKFGLGLKTASLSQCRVLTVASRLDPSTKRIEVRRWNLDHVEQSNRWEVEIVGSDDRPAYLVAPLHDHPGTVVLWESLERVLKYRYMWGESARTGLLKLAEQLDGHLGMVFHRFLSGEAHRRRRLVITINGTEVEPWDPFARDEAATEAFTPQEFTLSTPDGTGIVRYQPYVLPPRERFSSPRAFERTSGPEKWNRQQGFYIYRADRMIQSGGWSRMRTPDEHTKLARAALDFFPDLDAAFEVNVAKFTVKLPPELKEVLAQPVEQLIRRAKVVYGGDKVGRSQHPSPKISKGAPRPPVARTTLIHAADSTKKSISLRINLERAALEIGQETALQEIFGTLRKLFPEAADELGC
jgi:hypothetical protein